MSSFGALSPSQQAFFTKRLGVINVRVMREGVEDGVEITVFFEVNGKEDKVKFSESLEALDDVGVYSGIAMEWYMVGRAVQAISHQAFGTN